METLFSLLPDTIFLVGAVPQMIEATPDYRYRQVSISAADLDNVLRAIPQALDGVGASECVRMAVRHQFGSATAAPHRLRTLEHAL
jgi:hypothetical protein